MSSILTYLALPLLVFYIYKGCPYLVRITAVMCASIWINKLVLLLFKYYSHLLFESPPQGVIIAVTLFGLFLEKNILYIYAAFFTSCTIRFWWCQKISIIRNITNFRDTYAQIQNVFARGELDIEDIHRTETRKNSLNIKSSFPNGWIPLLESIELPRGETKPIFALGKAFAIFRGMNGKVYIMDAYCPHLGANLAIGGRVLGNCIECPFHMWQFNGEDGVCVKVPYAEKIPNGVKAGTWIADEKNGFIYIWHHVGGELPSWYIPDVGEVKNGMWTYKGRTDTMIYFNVKDAVENMLNTFLISAIKYDQNTSENEPSDEKAEGSHMSTKLCFQNLNSTWETTEDTKNSHISLCNFNCTIQLLGNSIPVTGIIEQFGPATSVLRGKSMFGDFFVIQGFIPDNSFRTTIIQQFYFRKIFPQFLANRVINAFDKSSYKDEVVLKKEIKTHMTQEEVDRLKNSYLQWTTQFYSKQEAKVNADKEYKIEEENDKIIIS